MEREVLEGFLAEGLSLEEIGRRLGRSPSTVAYWLGNGLEARNRERHLAKGRLERDRLDALIQEGLTVREIAQRVDRSFTTVRYWMSRYGLKSSRVASAGPRESWSHVWNASAQCMGSRSSSSSRVAPIAAVSARPPPLHGAAGR